MGNMYTESLSVNQNDSLWKSLATSLIVCIPTFVLSIWLIENPMRWSSPGAVMFVILGISAANFAAIIFLEHYRSKIGSLTLPTLIGAIGVVMVFIMAQALNRFVRDFGYEWLLPLVAAYVGLSLFAIFKEKTLLLKFFLGFNSAMIGVLWGLGAADKITLPF